MLHWAVVFFVLALLLGMFGFLGAAGIAAEGAKIFAVIFIILFVVSLLFRGGPPDPAI